jgi:putative transposase
MSRIVRSVRRPGVYFVTTDTWERRKLFLTPAWTRVLLEQILSCRERGFYELHAFVIMPDHLHVLLTPSTDATVEKAMQMIKGGSSHRIKEELGSSFPIWHAGFHDHWIRDENEYRTRFAYIAANPVTAKLVLQAEEYEWSSANGKYVLDAGPYDQKQNAAGAKAL